MSNNVFFLENQIYLVAFSFALGALCGLYFDILSVKRQVFRRGRVIEFIDDFLAVLLFFLLLFCFSLEYNHGIIRWYDILSFVVAFSLYRKLFHKAVYSLFLRLLNILLIPLRLVLRTLNRASCAAERVACAVINTLHYKYKRKLFCRLARKGFDLV